MHRSLAGFLFSVGLAVLLTSCSNPPMRIHSDVVPPGSLRLAQITGIARRADVVELKELHEAILAAGVADSEIVDGSVARARVHCCGGADPSMSSEKLNEIMLFVPQGMTVGALDIVEVKAGRPPRGGDGGILNLLTRKVAVRDEADQAPCWWDPKLGQGWLRVLYCDWMEGEGWVKQGGLRPAWYKPPAAGH